MARGKTLRIISGAEATVVWTPDRWALNNQVGTVECDGLNLWFADLSTSELLSASIVEFTFFWKANQHWEGRNWQVAID
jgi:hypothetical protein